MKAIIAFVTLAVMACTQAVGQESQAPRTPTSSQIGRFKLYPASGDMPAVLLDTVTGCMELIEKFQLDDGSKTPIWIRSVSDEVKAGTPKRCQSQERSK